MTQEELRNQIEYAILDYEAQKEDGFGETYLMDKLIHRLIEDVFKRYIKERDAHK